ncbi:hypothetical protein HAX54_015795 [Datura stramonium]|uniref:Uncharacterized protein n=1 Tax=Datura stramonium TaxID=4076 RepID=A0ABS8S072_DATST|nr:hypothetical protein [Datura stramonium]
MDGDHKSLGEGTNRYDGRWKNVSLEAVVTTSHCSKSRDEITGLLASRNQGGHQNFQSQYRGNNAPPPPPNNIEDMFKTIIANQAQMQANYVKLATDMKNQQLATKALEYQFGQLAGAQNTKPRGGLPSDTDPNPK